MKRTLRALLSSGQLTQLVSEHLIEAREVDVVPGSLRKAELMAITTKNALGGVEISQYRFEVEVECSDWRD